MDHSLRDECPRYRRARVEDIDLSWGTTEKNNPRTNSNDKQGAELQKFSIQECDATCKVVLVRLLGHLGFCIALNGRDTIANTDRGDLVAVK